MSASPARPEAHRARAVRRRARITGAVLFAVVAAIMIYTVVRQALGYGLVGGA